MDPAPTGVRAMLGALRRFQWTLSALVLGVLFWLINHVFDLDLFEQGMALLATAERFELDELIFLVILISLGIAADALLHRQRQTGLLALQAQRMQILKTTMRTVLDIHGNFLNQVNFFVYTAQESGLTQETLEEMKAAIRTASTQLQQLANLKDLPESALSTGETMIDLRGGEKDRIGGRQARGRRMSSGSPDQIWIGWRRP